MLKNFDLVFDLVFLRIFDLICFCSIIKVELWRRVILTRKTFKNKKFWKIFLIPYGIWFLLTLIAMIPDPTETDPLTWGDFVLANILMFVIWGFLSIIISFIVYLIKKYIKKDKIEVQSNNIENNKKTIKQNEIKNYKFKKILMIILFIITIASLWLAMGCMLLFHTTATNGFAFVQNTWVFWLWLPVPVLSIILGFKFKKQGLKCKKNIIGGFIIAPLLLLYGSFWLTFKDLNDFTNSIFVITQSNFNNEIKYYEVNDNKNIRVVDEFQSQANEFYTDDSCFDHTVEINKLNFEKCEFEDKNKNIVETNELFKNILTNISKVEESWVSEVKILKTNEKYFVMTRLNVNLWTPYVLYEYNVNNNELKHIYTFSNEDVIGIKLK